MKLSAKNFLVFLLLFLGIGALYGGGSFIIDPSGKLLGMPISMLESSPFNSFLVPGIILFLVFGIAPILLVFALIKKTDVTLAEHFNCFKDMHWSWSFTIYIAISLIVWIQVQELLIQAIGWIHVFYIFLALFILGVALLPSLRAEFKK